MLAQQQYQKYQQNAVLTASPAKLTLMLYNGAIKFCDQAVEAIKRKDMAESHQCNMKAQKIILELRITLDSKFQYAEDMNRLYLYITELLVQGNVHKDCEKILEARELIVEFRDTWLKVMELAR